MTVTNMTHVHVHAHPHTVHTKHTHTQTNKAIGLAIYGSHPKQRAFWGFKIP